MPASRPSIHLRLPAGLLAELRAEAERQEISLNSLVLAIVSGAVGWQPAHNSHMARAEPDIVNGPWLNIYDQVEETRQGVHDPPEDAPWTEEEKVYWARRRMEESQPPKPDMGGGTEEELAEEEVRRPLVRGGRPPVRGPLSHWFASSSEAYDATQSNDSIKNGDVLAVPAEGVYGVLVKAWPMAVSENHGAFLTLSPRRGTEVPAEYRGSVAEAFRLMHNRRLDEEQAREAQAQSKPDMGGGGSTPSDA